jgi:hypothetical protein
MNSDRAALAASRLKKSRRFFRAERAGAPMTTIQAVILGGMITLTPSLVLLAFLIWREGIGLRDDGKLNRSHNLEVDGQPPYRSGQ